MKGLLGLFILVELWEHLLVYFFATENTIKYILLSFLELATTATSAGLKRGEPTFQYLPCAGKFLFVPPCNVNNKPMKWMVVSLL